MFRARVNSVDRLKVVRSEIKLIQIKLNEKISLLMSVTVFFPSYMSSN